MHMSLHATVGEVKCNLVSPHKVTFLRLKSTACLSQAKGVEWLYAIASFVGLPLCRQLGEVSVSQLKLFF